MIQLPLPALCVRLPKQHNPLTFEWLEQPFDIGCFLVGDMRGKVGWIVGGRIEVARHYRRPHLMLAWTGPGRAVPRVVPRRGRVVHREFVEKVPSGWGE